MPWFSVEYFVVFFAFVRRSTLLSAVCARTQRAWSAMNQVVCSDFSFSTSHFGESDVAAARRRECLACVAFKSPRELVKGGVRCTCESFSFSSRWCVTSAAWGDGTGWRSDNLLLVRESNVGPVTHAGTAERALFIWSVLCRCRQKVDRTGRHRLINE